MQEPIVLMRDIEKVYHMGEEDHRVLKGVSLSVDKGEFVAILGPSGSGKSTLMNILGCLDTPTSGEYILHDRPVQELDEEDLAAIRSREVGFIFQSFQLLPRMNALRNVMLPLIYAGFPVKERESIAIKMLQRVGLSDKLHHFPNQLSGGQQQRVAIARALSTNPTILLADEPTGALDQKTGRQVMALFHELNEEGHTILMITHDAAIASHAGRVVRLLDGRLTEGGEEDAEGEL
jgi:putative ABC transport system ATP-binding protein